MKPEMIEWDTLDNAISMITTAVVCSIMGRGIIVDSKLQIGLDRGANL